MISNLPRDLIEEIIYRVPLKTMKEVRLTCKTWNNLSKNESLRKATRITREDETMMIATKNHNLYLMSVSVDDVDPSMDIRGKISFVVNDEFIVTGVLHFEGLLLFKLKDVTTIVVWNPYLEQTVWIKLRFSHPQGLDCFNYALGYEDKESCHSLKLLRCMDFFYEAPANQFFWYEIYDFDSGLWTTLDATPHWGISYASRGASLKGNTYWCAKQRSSKDINDHIIGFDFTRERFGPLLPLPTDVMNDHYACVTLSCVKEEKLAALFQHIFESKLEIWITTKIDVEMVSWSKFLRVDTGLKVEVPVSFFIDEEKKLYMSLNRDTDSGYLKDDPKPYINIIQESGYFKEIDIGLHGAQNGRLHWCSYVPSLVQIRKPAKDKGKKKDNRYW